MELINTKSPSAKYRPSFLDEEFCLKMTGEELVRLYMLSFQKECGPQHSSKDRFCDVIEDYVDKDSNFFKNLFSGFKLGEYKQ